MLSYLNLTYRTMIKITNKIIKSADDYPLPYLQFEPENNTINKSIILVYEIFGLTDHIKNVAKEYAENGFLVAIPDIFSRFSNLFNNTFDNELRKNSFMPLSLIFLRIFSCSSMVISSLNRCSK